MKYLLIILLLAAQAAGAQDFFMLTGAASAPTAGIDRTIQTLHTTDDGKYNAFGTLVTISATKKMYVFRSGTDHLTGGSIDAVDYDVPSNTWSNRRTLIVPPAGTDYRDPRAGVINGRIYIFTSRRNNTSGNTEAQGYFRSTDLTGTAWSSFNARPKSYNIALPWGKLIAGDTPGTFFQPYYDSNLGAGQVFKVGMHKTTDYGETWSDVTIYSGTGLHVDEVWVINAGGGRMLALMRIDPYWGNVGGMAQSVSTDGGTTWGATTRSNLGGNVANIPVLYYHTATDQITCVYQDRQDGFLKISAFNTFNTVFSNPTGWKTPVNYEFNNDPADNGHKGLGYPDYDGEIMLWAKEVNANATFIKWRKEDLALFNQ